MDHWTADSKRYRLARQQRDPSIGASDVNSINQHLADYPTSCSDMAIKRGVCGDRQRAVLHGENADAVRGCEDVRGQPGEGNRREPRLREARLSKSRLVAESRARLRKKVK